MMQIPQSFPIRPLVVVLAISGCAAYVGGGYDQPLFLSARLIDVDGDPVNHCQAGVESDGDVLEWQAVDTNMRAIFELSILANEQRIIIQCSGYSEIVIIAAPQPSGGWVVNDVPTGANESVDLGELVLEARLGVASPK